MLIKGNIKMDRKSQIFMGTVFTGLGLATMLFPKKAAELSFKEEFLGKEGVSKPLKLTMQCFGSQATLCGILILTSKFTADTFKIFGLAMIPYLAFDYYAWQTDALTPLGAIGDAVGNVIFAACSLVGYNALTKK